MLEGVGFSHPSVADPLGWSRFNKSHSGVTASTLSIGQCLFRVDNLEVPTKWTTIEVSSKLLASCDVTEFHGTCIRSDAQEIFLKKTNKNIVTVTLKQRIYYVFPIFLLMFFDSRFYFIFVHPDSGHSHGIPQHRVTPWWRIRSSFPEHVTNSWAWNNLDSSTTLPHLKSTDHNTWVQ